MTSPQTAAPRATVTVATALIVALVLAAVDAFFSDVLLGGAAMSPQLLASQVALAAAVFGLVLVVAGLLACRFGRDHAAVRVTLERGAFLLAALVALAALPDLLEYVQVTGGIGLKAVGVGLVVLVPPVASRLVAKCLTSRKVRRAGLVVSGALCVLMGVTALPWPPSPRTVTAATGQRTQPVTSVRRVILLTVDTLRRDALQVYADDAPATPALGRLAADSVVYEAAASPAPWTLPAFASIHTGVLPDVHGTTRFDRALPPQLTTLAERMQAAGYRTAAFGYNPFLSPVYRLDRGFERYEMYPRAASGAVGARLLGQVAPDAFGEAFDAADITRLGLEWVERHAGEPFFLWVHYFDPHLPYAPPEGYRPGGTPPPRIGMRFASEMLASVRSGHWVPAAEEAAWLRRLYDGEVRYTDAMVGRFLDRLRELGLYEDTLIVFASDHGEEFWEHGGFEHGHSVHEEVIGVPLFVKRPGAVAGGRVSAPVSTVSIPATVLDVCGLRVEGDGVSGRSLLTAVDVGIGTEPPASDAVTPIVSTACAYFEDQVAVRLGDWKWIRTSLSGREWLFDLSSDPGEQRPLGSPDGGTIVERLRELLGQHHEASAALRGLLLHEERAGSADLAEAQMRALRALGYVD